MERKSKDREYAGGYFLNYVLFHRVNEEEIAPCRTFFYSELAERTRGMDIKAAALEINYWCAQESAYHCTDDRTLSAISVYRRGIGRCGEKSVLTVNAAEKCRSTFTPGICAEMVSL